MEYKVIVFDLGGTLMEYVGMPHSWVGYYRSGFEYVNKKLKLNLSETDINTAIQVLTEYNPRVNPREVEHSAEFLFKKATEHISFETPLDDFINDFIDEFFSGLTLKSKIYDDTFETISLFKNKGYKIATLTNLPSSMPDRLFVKDIKEILAVLDLYVSSEICGFRKPNPYGLQYISEKFGVSISDLIFVGDEKLDIETANRAGCNSVLINRFKEIKNYGQTHTINDLKSIITVFSE